MDRLAARTAGIVEMRPVAAIDVELQKAQPEAQAVWRITDGCRDVTRPASARACATVLELRQAHAAAARRDAIDAELRELRPKTDGAAGDRPGGSAGDDRRRDDRRASAGTFNPAPSDIARLRALALRWRPRSPASSGCWRCRWRGGADPDVTSW